MRQGSISKISTVSTGIVTGEESILLALVLNVLRFL